MRTRKCTGSTIKKRVRSRAGVKRVLAARFFCVFLSFFDRSKKNEAESPQKAAFVDIKTSSLL